MTIRASHLGATCVLSALCSITVACSSSSSDKKDADGGTGATRGAGAGGSQSVENGGAQGDGGATSSGGAKVTGGAKGSGGKSATGGKSGGGGAAGGGSGGGDTASGGDTGTGGAPLGPTTAKAVAAKIGKDHFIIGMGNDLNNDHNQDGAYTLGTTLDVHYAYLVGLMGQGGWPDWNQGGTFVNVLTDTAKSHGGVVPMMTLYSMAAKGEANIGALTDDSYMKPYWDGAKLMFQRLGAFGDPSAVNFEPDWWAYAEQKSADPSMLPVHIKAHAPDCASLPDTMVGMGKCLVVLARKYAPKAIVGFHASTWADGDPSKIVAYFKAIGAADADFVTTDMLDRDAGCFEAHTDPNCQRGGDFYFDETNKTSPNFHENLAWVKTITDGLGKPMLWWQVPFGVPSTTPGGTAGHYRDNRVHYIFSHIDEFIAAGGLGAVFGTGAGNQTYIDSDGDQFKNAVAKYFAAPVKLP